MFAQSYSNKSEVMSFHVKIQLNTLLWAIITFAHHVALMFSIEIWSDTMDCRKMVTYCMKANYSIRTMICPRQMKGLNDSF